MDQMIANTGPSGTTVMYFKSDPSLPADRNTILTPLSDPGMDGSAWQTLPMATRLGVDLVFITKTEFAGHPTKNILAICNETSNERNITLEVLTIDCDPESTTFGQSTKKVRGAVLFKLRDAEKWSPASEPLDAFELFIKDRLALIKAALKDQGMEAAKAEYAKMCPKEFKKVFKQWRAAQAEKWKGKGWEKKQCAVKIDGDACEACGTDGGKAEGTALMRCGKCRKVLYCSRDCQVEDRKAHKPFCRA